MKKISKVLVWEEDVIIPTYEVGKPDKNPLFLERRVYQGSSGKVYPHPVIDKIFDEKVNKVYKALFLENDYLKIMILPELGGRVQRAYDKIKKYDFVYYNHVIKPALVGLAGPWISGGIEFNWPQHHRPSTFDKVNYSYHENADGSAVIIISEIENMFHTKGETEFILYPDKAYLELKNHLYNMTFVDQTFLWWANPAVSVNENYSSIFPPDVTAVMDHGKRDVSTFPIATGTYYKVDYSRGVDISKYNNLPVPTSYMAAKSNFDFVGGYDYGKEAGILHVADHHISPGKKQWTWGSGEFGKAWDKNLTDEDGPYFELMTGCFTDNQPDFSYIGAMESKHFTQYFMPYHDLGVVHNATKDLVLHVDVEDIIKAKFYCSGTVNNAIVDINGHQEKMIFKCGKTYEIVLDNNRLKFEDIDIKVIKDDVVIFSFKGNYIKHPIPESAKAAPKPIDCKSLEELFLYGTHIEQYRHATRRAEDYYLEGLKRDPTDIRLNNAYGLLLLKKGLFIEAEQYFRKAIEKECLCNTNYLSGNVHYNLGLDLFYQGRFEEAYDAFYKATWNNDSKSNAYYFLAVIESRQKQYRSALELVNSCLLTNPENSNALNLKTMILKSLKMDYLDNVKQSLKYDELDILALYIKGEDISRHIINPNMLIDLSLKLAIGGFNKEALSLLELSFDKYPMLDYYRYFFSGDYSYLIEAFNDSEYCCFPNRLEDIIVLKEAIKNNPNDFKAYYYLGNLYFDKERHADAISCFAKSIELGANFPTPYRNLSLLCFNVLSDKEKALSLMNKAFEMDKSDARVLYELDLLKKRIGVSIKERLSFLNSYMNLVNYRDDLYLEYVTLLNLNKQYKKALSMLLDRHFHPWEGGEGKVSEQYIFSNTAIGTIDSLKATFIYPDSLGEGKLFGAQENRQNYYLGCLTNDNSLFEKASTGISEPASVMYYNDQPPETIFYQGMALLKLNKIDEANSRFNKLINYANEHINDEIEIDYFAVSLPDLLVFNEDLNLKNKMHCMFMKALGLYGLGKTKDSKTIFEELINMNPNIFQISTHYDLLFKEND